MIYHYTKSTKLASILTHGLRPRRILLAPGEKPVLWFTTNDRWEDTGLTIDAPSLGGAHDFVLKLGARLIRIACDDDVAPHGWNEIQKLAATPAGVAARLYELATGAGSRPDDWKGTLNDVTVEKCRAFEMYDGKEWVAWVPGFPSARPRR
jgi:hypothetical protein